MGSIAFRPGQRVFLDSNALIYWVEDVRPYCDLLSPVFEAALRGELTLVISALSLLETLVEPLRHGDEEKAQRFREIVRDSPGVEYRAIDDEVLEKAASLRAETGLRTPDAILVATSILAGCDVLITNDARLKGAAGPGAILLSETAGA
ncbi:MAG: type II toxin-antitoxin system VapC family toxin [Planctomycetota bacterium]